MGQKKRAELLSVCSHNLKKSKSCESIIPWIENGPKRIEKKLAFIFRKTTYHLCFHLDKNINNVLMLVFSVHFIIFFYFLKCPKSKKNGKMSQKSHFSLCSAALFPTFPRYTLCFVFSKLYLKIKTQKNMKKKF